MKIGNFNFAEKRNSTGNLHLDVDSIQSHGLGLAFHGPNGRLGEISSTFGHSQPLRFITVYVLNFFQNPYDYLCYLPSSLIVTLVPL